MTISINQVKAITHDLVLKALADNVYQSAAGLRRFYSKRVKVDGGNDIGGPIIIGGLDLTTGGWYNGASNLTDAEKEDITRAKVDWKQVYETVVLSNLDIMKNGGSAQVLSLVASKIKIAEKRLKSRLSSGIFSDGSDSLVFDGLGLIIGTSAYAGLSASDFDNESGADAWQSAVLANGATPRALSGSLIQRAMGQATEDEDKPTVSFMKQNVFDELWSILEPHQRLMVENEDLSGLGHDQNKKVLKYNGIPFLVDSHMEAACMYFVNEDYVKLYVHKMEDMKAQSFDKLEGQNAIKERMLLTGNLFCNNRRYQAKLDDINVAS